MVVCYIFETLSSWEPTFASDSVTVAALADFGSRSFERGCMRNKLSEPMDGCKEYQAVTCASIPDFWHRN
jgi:hypothetical protein